MRPWSIAIGFLLFYRFLEKEYGFKIVHLRVDKFGFVDVAQLDLCLNPDVAMVTCMLANNEIGSIQPIAELVRHVRAFERKSLL